MAKVTLAGARVSSGFTQQELADKMGISRQCLFDFEHNKREMKRAYVVAFCALTGFDEDDIILPSRTTLSGETA